MREKRQAKRHLPLPDVKATFRYYHGEKQLEARSIDIRDISYRGCCFNTKEAVNFNCGQKGKLKLQGESSIVEFDATIARLWKDGMAVLYEPFTGIKVYFGKEKPYILQKSKQHFRKIIPSDCADKNEALKIQSLIKPLGDYSVRMGELVDISAKGQITNGVGSALTSVSLLYYLSIDGGYFLDAADLSESPLYVAFLVISLLAIRNLLSICGKKKPKTIVAGILGGITGGSGVGAIITGMAFGLIMDIVTLGGATIIGGFIGYLLTRRGKKRHADPCGIKLPCDTWICPKCRKLIKPSKAWIHKDIWNILDVCDYLDTGGLEMDIIQALAFLDFSNLLGSRTDYSGFPVLWERTDVKDRARDKVLFKRFANAWSQFQEQLGISTLVSKPLQIERLLDQWNKFRLKEGL